MSKKAKKIAESDRRNPGLKSETWGSFSEYLALTRWLVPDVLRHGGWSIAGVMLLSVASVAARGATAGSVLYYVRAQSKGTSVVLLGQELPSDASILAFSLWGGAALVFALLDVGARSWGDRINFRISESYASAGMQHLLRHIAAGGSFDPPREIELPNRYPLVGVLQLDTQRLVRVVVQALSLPTPLITFLVVAAVLLSINAVLTLVLLPLFGGYSLAIAAVNRRMLRDSQRRRHAIREVRNDLQGIAMTLQRTRYPSEALPGWLTSFPSKSWMERSVRAFGGMWFARRRVLYLRDGFNGIALLLMVMVFGTLLASTNTSWTILLTYLVALGYGVTSMDKFSRLVTAANRQIPHVRRYVWFMQTHGDTLVRQRTSEAASEAASDGPLRISVVGDALPGSRDDLELAPGRSYYCAFDEELESRNIGPLCLALTGGNEERARALEADSFSLGRIVRLPERSIRTMLSPDLKGKEQRARVEDFLDAIGLRDEFDTRIGNLDATITEVIDQQSSPALRFVVRLLPALASDARVAFVGATAISELDSAQCTRILDALRNQVVLIVPDDPSSPLPADAQDVLVVCDGALRGIGDREWHEGLRSTGQVETPKWLLDAKQSEKERAAFDFDDDDDDDDD